MSNRWVRWSTASFVTLLAQRAAPAAAQGRDAAVPTHADSVRGAENANRSWWDATFYDLNVRVNPRDSSFAGWNRITYRALQSGQTMQLDLQAPLELDSVVQGGKRLDARRDGDMYLVTLPASQRPGAPGPSLTAYYHGQPGRGHPPRSSGVVWSQDSLAAPWIATTDQ